jgi:hypothetical protein
VVGAAGVWYGLVENVEIGFAAGILIWVAPRSSRSEARSH